jgi:hypothetical protein
VQDFTTHQRFRRKRGRLKRESVCALVVVLAGCGFGFVDSLTQRIVPRPDYHNLLFTELARQTTLQTGTPTIVKEDDSALAMFEREFNRRNARFGISAQQIAMPDNEVFGFSFAPGMIDQTGTGLMKTAFSQLVKQHGALTIYEDEPGTHPMVIWTYSRREGLLAVFLYQLLTPDHPLAINPPHPDPRFKQYIDWNGVVSVQGSIPNVTIFPEHAFLVPLGDMKLENFGPRARDMPQLFVLQHALPAVVSPGHDPAKVSVPNAGETIMLLRTQATRPFIFTRRVFRLGVLPLGLLWLGTNFWRMRRLHRSFSTQLAELAPTEMPWHHTSFAAFLTADLEAAMAAAAKEAHSIQEKMLAAERERAQIDELRDELQRYVLQNEAAPGELARIDRALNSELLLELRSLTDHYRRKMETEKQIAREQQREIQWLVSEFEAVPQLKRRNEAREAWALYERALTCDDAKTKLHWLKEARKKLPRGLRELNAFNSLL